MTTTAQGTSKAPGFTTLGRRTDDDGGADGPDGGSATARTARTRLIWGAAVVLLVLAAVGLNLTRTSSSVTPYAPDNAEPEGARAAAQILSERGVDITLVTTTAAALADAREDGTLLVLTPDDLRPEQLRALAGARGDLVLVEIGYRGIADLTSAVEVEAGGSRGLRLTQCSDPDAEAAGRMFVSGPQVVGTGGDVTTCFPAGGDVAGGAYAVWQEDGRTMRALPDGFPLTNAGLALQGNAALVLRALGQHEHLTWYIPDPADPFGIDDGPVQTLPVSPAVILQLLAVGLAVVLWRGRRLGRVVVEPLPVVVRAAETTRGRGRLYRRANAHAHAAAALRAGAVSRVAGRIGLPNTAGEEEVLDALARATGRPAEALRSLLYGPPPHDDDSLIALTQALDTMESEVHRA